MAVEITANATQTVAVGANVLFTETPIRCNKGYVLHREGSGIITLRGITNQCRARYAVSFGANIAIPEEATVEPISLALALDGEPLPTTTMTVTPAAVGEFFNVYTSAIIDVPCSCCESIAVENISTVPVDVANASLKIERLA